MNKSGFYIGALVVIAGLVMLISPEQSIKIVVIVLGAGSVLTGLFDIISVRSLSDDLLFKKTALIRGLASIVIGLLAISLPLAFAETVLKIMLYSLAVYLIISAIGEFILLIKLPEDSSMKKSFLLEAVGFIALAVILFILPANFGKVIVRILGLLLILGGAGYAYYSWKTAVPLAEVVDVRDADDESATEQKDSE